jgi:hypothetical protein
MLSSSAGNLDFINLSESGCLDKNKRPAAPVSIVKLRHMVTRQTLCDRGRVQSRKRSYAPGDGVWEKTLLRRDVSGERGQALVVLHIPFLPRFVRTSYAGLYAGGCVCRMGGFQQKLGTKRLSRDRTDPRPCRRPRRSVPASGELPNSPPPSGRSIPAGSLPCDRRNYAVLETSLRRPLLRTPRVRGPADLSRLSASPSAGVWPHDGITISAAAKRARPRAHSAPPGRGRSCERRFALCANGMNPKEAGGPRSVRKAMRSIVPMLLAKSAKCPPARRTAASRRIPNLSVPSFSSAILFGRPRRRNGHAPPDKLRQSVA